MVKVKAATRAAKLLQSVKHQGPRSAEPVHLAKLHINERAYADALPSVFHSDECGENKQYAARERAGVKVWRGQRAH